MSECLKTKMVYTDALNKIQFNANNLKLTFVETEDLGDDKLETSEVVKLVMSVESAAKMVNAIAKFLNNLADSKKESELKKEVPVKPAN